MTGPLILHVEDNISDIDLFDFAWREAGHQGQVITVQTCDEAVQHLNEADDAGRLPELILLDLNLPSCHGTEILLHLRQQDLDIPVVVLTSSANPQDRRRCLELGAVSYLVKPFSYKELQQVIEEVAEHLRPSA